MSGLRRICRVITNGMENLIFSKVKGKKFWHIDGGGTTRNRTMLSTFETDQSRIVILRCMTFLNNRLILCYYFISKYFQMFFIAVVESTLTVFKLSVILPINYYIGIENYNVICLPTRH